MTDPHDRHGEILRRLLHAEAARIEPSPDGLDRIRAGIAQRKGRRLGALSGWTLGGFRLPGGWTRPVLAVAVTISIVVLGVSAPQTIDRITSAGRHGPAGESGLPATGTSGTSGSGHTDPVPATPGPGQPTAPAPGGQVTTPIPGAPGMPACSYNRDPAPSKTPSTTDSGATESPSPCPTPSDPGESPDVTTEPESPAVTDPETPPGGNDVTTPPESTEPAETGESP